MPFPYPALCMAPTVDGNPTPAQSWLLQPRVTLRREQQRLQQQLAWRASRATSKIIQEEERIKKKINKPKNPQDTLII